MENEIGIDFHHGYNKHTFIQISDITGLDHNNFSGKWITTVTYKVYDKFYSIDFEDTQKKCYHDIMDALSNYSLLIHLP